MSRLVVKSHLEDIKGFMNLVPDRIEKIREGSLTPIPEEYGVNYLSSKLHPKSLKLKISNIKKVPDGIRIISLKSDNELPIFRAGQNLNIKHGSFSYPFSLLCSSNSKIYEIAVFENSDDEVSKYLCSCNKGDIIEASGIEGLFYYTALRDRKKVVAVCDNYGIPAIISMVKSINSGIECFDLKIIYIDKKHSFKDILESIPNIQIEYAEVFSETGNENCSIFISGNSDFCKNIKAKISSEKIRVNIVNANQKSDSGEIKHICRVKYRDKNFEFFCFENETLLSAFEKNGVPSASKCKVGECGYCRCKLIEGNVETINVNGIDSRRSADIKYNFIHPCRSFPKSNLTIEL